MMNEKQETALRLAREALKKCDSALAEELAAWDIDPPLHHVLEASNACGPAIAAIDEVLSDNALDKMADNAIELGLDYESSANAAAVNTSSERVDKTAKNVHEQPAQPDCPECGNNRQVWDNQITGKKTCHRAGCHQEIEQPAPVEEPH